MCAYPVSKTRCEVEGVRTGKGWNRENSPSARWPALDCGCVGAGSAGSSNGGSLPREAQLERHHFGAGGRGGRGSQLRLFPSNPKERARSRSREASRSRSVFAESPPNDSVGFFFGATPPENR
jgi:hypothetical protein